MEKILVIFQDIMCYPLSVVTLKPENTKYNA